jgi:hypothetical protein
MLDPPRTPRLVFVLTVVVAVGACALVAGALVPALLGGLGAWPVVVAGLLLVIGALVALWVMHRRRDRTLW